jgi:GTPase SAR1 family protein
MDKVEIKIYFLKIVLIFIFIYSNQQPLSSGDNFIRRRPMSNEGNEKLFDVQYKVLLLGDTSVGKTSLKRCIAGKDFRPDIFSSIGINKNFNLKNRIKKIPFFF